MCVLLFPLQVFLPLSFERPYKFIQLVQQNEPSWPLHKQWPYFFITPKLHTSAVFLITQRNQIVIYFSLQIIPYLSIMLFRDVFIKHFEETIHILHNNLLWHFGQCLRRLLKFVNSAKSEKKDCSFQRLFLNRGYLFFFNLSNFFL